MEREEVMDGVMFVSDDEWAWGWRNEAGRLFHMLAHNHAIFRSTPKSRPNNMGQMSVRPKNVFPIPMKFGM